MEIREFRKTAAKRYKEGAVRYSEFHQLLYKVQANHHYIYKDKICKYVMF